MGEEHGVELVARGAGLDEAQHGGATRIELERRVAVAHEHAGTGPARADVRYPGAGEGDRRGHRHTLRIVPMPSIHVSRTWPGCRARGG